MWSTLCGADRTMWVFLKPNHKGTADTPGDPPPLTDHILQFAGENLENAPYVGLMLLVILILAMLPPPIWVTMH